MKLKLDRLNRFNGRPGPLVFIIMDGIGIGKNDESDAVFVANTPTIDMLRKLELQVSLKAHGPAVGLPGEGDMGNSEVGHNAIGAGRVFDQGAKLVNRSLKTGEIYKTELWQKIIERGKQGKTIHFLGLLSDGNVHSHIDHLFALIRKCEETGIKNVRVHTLLDGRDVDRKSALNYLDPTEKLLKEISGRGMDYRMASGGGRMVVTMDRYRADWNVVKRGWDAHVHGIGRTFSSATEAVKTYYNEDSGATDQYLDSYVIVDDRGEPVGKVKDGDVFLNFNFRGDRAIEISMAFEDDDFDFFDRGNVPGDILYAGMLEYDGDLKIPNNYLVPPPDITKTVSEYLCSENVQSFAISETQKYGHVTYFWNGNRSGYINEDVEEYFEILSDKIEFDRAPKMKAYEITSKVIELLETGKFRFGRINYANGDMVGHTGNELPIITAVETVDECVGRILERTKELNGIVIVSADHGNADEMFVMKNEKKIIKTAHSLNPVNFFIYDPLYDGEYVIGDVKNPGLSNIAATLLNLLGFEKPEDYDDSLIKFI